MQVPDSKRNFQVSGWGLLTGFSWTLTEAQSGKIPTVICSEGLKTKSFVGDLKHIYIHLLHILCPCVLNMRAHDIWITHTAQLQECSNASYMPEILPWLSFPLFLTSLQACFMTLFDFGNVHSCVRTKANKKWKSRWIASKRGVSACLRILCFPASGLYLEFDAKNKRFYLTRKPKFCELDKQAHNNACIFISWLYLGAKMFCQGQKVAGWRR